MGRILVLIMLSSYLKERLPTEIMPSDFICENINVIRRRQILENAWISIFRFVLIIKNAFKEEK